MGLRSACSGRYVDGLVTILIIHSEQWIVNRCEQPKKATKKGVILLFRKRGQSKNQNDPFLVCPLFWSVGLGLWAGLGRQFFDQVFDRAGVFDSLGTGIDQVAGDAVLLAELTQLHPEVR